MIACGRAVFLAALILAGRPVSALADEPWTWTGPYLGLHAGWGSASRTTHLPAPFPTDIEPEASFGWLGGALAGFNYSMGQWVLGGEVDVAWGSPKPRQTVFEQGSDVAFHQFTAIDLMGTARARLGFALDRWHLYATGGVAWLQASAEIIATDGPTETARGSASATHVGWVAGAGVEYAGSGNLFFRLEYLYHDLGGASYDFNIPGGQTSADLEVWVARAAVGYKF
jgi:opacity protein-like surface antigen